MNEKFEEWWEKHGAYNKFWTSHAAAECAWEAAENRKTQIAPPNLTSESADGTAPEPECKLFCERCQAWVKYQTAFGEGLVIYICKQCYAAIM